MVDIKIDVKGLDELQKKLSRFPDEIERIRREIFLKYGRKIEREAREACPDEKTRASVKVIFLSNGNFEVNYSSEAKLYVDPIMQRNIKDIHKEIEKRIGEAWQT